MPTLVTNIRWTDNTRETAANIANGLGVVNRSVGEVRQQVREAAKVVSDLEKAMKDIAPSGKALVDLSAELAKAKGAHAALKQELAALDPKAKGAADSLKRVGREGATAAKGLKDAGDSAKAAGEKAEQAKANFQQIGAALSTVGRGMTATITAPIVGAAAAAVKFASDFEADMVKVHTLSGVTESDMQRMKGAILALAPAVGIGPDELAKAMLAVTSTGLTGARAMDVLTISAKASAVGMGDAATIARTITSIIKAYGEENITAARASEVMFKIVKDGNADAAELAGALGRVVGIASTLGVAFEDVGTFIATFTRIGVNTNEAVTALRGFIGALQLKKPSDDAKAALASVGLTFDQLRTSIKQVGLTATALDLFGRFKGHEEDLQPVIANIRAMAGAMGTYGAQAKDVVAIQKHMVEQGHELEDAFGRTKDTAAFKFKQLTAELQALAITVGAELLPHLNSLIKDTLIPGVHTVEGWVRAWRQLPEPVKDFSLVIAGLGAAGGPVLLGLGALARSIGAIQLLLFGSNAVSATSVAAFLSKVGLSSAAPAATTAKGAGLAALQSKLGWGGAVAQGLPKLGALATGGFLLGNSAMSLSGADADKARAEINAWLSKAFVDSLPRPTDARTDTLFPGGKPPMIGATGIVRGTRIENVVGQSKALQSVADKVKALTQAEREDILAKRAQGLATKDIATETGIASNVISAFLKQHTATASEAKKATTEALKLAKAHEQIRLAAVPLTDSQLAVALSLLRVNDAAGETIFSIDEIAKEAKAAPTQIKLLKASLDELHAIEKGTKLTGPLAGFNLINPKQEIKDFQEIRAALRKMGTEKVGVIDTSQLETDIETIGHLKGKLDQAGEAAKKAKQHTDEWLDIIDQMASAINRVGQSVGGLFGAYLQGIGAAIRSTTQFADGIRRAQAAAQTAGHVTAASFAQAATSVFGLYMAAIDVVEGITAAENAADRLANSRKIVQQLAADFALAGRFSDALNSSLEETIHSLKVISSARSGTPTGTAVTRSTTSTGAPTAQILAESLKINEIIEELGGLSHLTSQQLEMVMDRVQRLFFLIEKGGPNGVAAIKALDSVLADMGANATKSGGLVSKFFLDMLAKARAAGIELEKVNAFLLEQTQTNVVGGLAAFVGGGKDAAKDLDEVKKNLVEIKDERDDLMRRSVTPVTSKDPKTGKITTTTGLGVEDSKRLAELNKQWADLEAKAKSAQAIIKAGAVTSQSAATALGASVLAAFEEMRRQGVPISEIMEKLGPIIDELGKKFDAAGFSGGAAFDAVREMAALATDEIAGPIISGINGLGQALTGLHNIGALNEETFLGLTRQIKDGYNALAAQGKGGVAALRLLQPTLQTIWALHKDTGMAIDAETQALLDEAEAQGIVGDKQRPIQEQMLLATNKIVKAVEALAGAFGYLPDAAGDAADGINSEFGRIKTPRIKIPIEWQMPEGVPSGTIPYVPPSPNPPTPFPTGILPRPLSNDLSVSAWSMRQAEGLTATSLQASGGTVGTRYVVVNMGGITVEAPEGTPLSDMEAFAPAFKEALRLDTGLTRTAVEAIVEKKVKDLS